MNKMTNGDRMMNEKLAHLLSSHCSGIDLVGQVIVSEDHALCLYDYADILLEEEDPFNGN